MTAGAPAADGAIDYLLCIEGERSWTVPLPADGALVIGRGDEASLRLADPLVSRSHAQLLVVPDGLRLADLGSRHGTLLNGRRLGAAQLVSSGDVITVGSTILVVHRPQRAATGRGLVADAALALRLEEEVERALRYHRELTLVCVHAATAVDRARVAAALAPRLRLMDSAALVGDGDVVVLLPEIGGDEAGERATALASTLATVMGPVATAVAVSPADGCDADTLLSAVRTTAEAGAPDTLGWVADQVRRIELGEREVVLADPAMVRLYDLVRRLARSDLPILIQGETGVGKELAAAAVHTFSTRATGPFVSINCAAIPEALAESELFGHERGAFSGAVASKPGRLELGSGGTVFLDELGELPLAVQAKLLRVLESGELMRVGDVKVRTADIRLVAATNRDLAAEVEAGRFRRDLFFRLGAAQIVLPPLRDRPRDLALLARQLADDACARLGRSPVTISVAATQALFLHRWPGNVRELRNAMDYACAAMPDTSDELELWHLPAPVAAAVTSAAPSGEPTLALGTAPRMAAAPALALGTGDHRGFRPIADEVRDLERQRMIAALAATAGVQNRAAELIDMPLRTFVTKLKRYGIAPADWQAPPQ
jgi:two-component system response regulator AtoC